MFSDCVSLIAVLRFFVGYGVGGIQSSHFAFIMEMIGPKHRSFASAVYQMYFNFGFHGVNIVSYFVRDWRPVILITSLPALLLFLFVRFV